MDKRLALSALALLLAGCVQPAFRPEGPVSAITPAAPPEAITAAAGERVIWGGVVVDITNLARNTELEILAHPLNRAQRPRRGEPALGRFIARYPGFLEPVEFAPGRLVTVLGQVDGLTTGRVGEARYRFPVVAAAGVHLWRPEKPGGDVHFGVGIGIIGP